MNKKGSCLFPSIGMGVPIRRCTYLLFDYKRPYSKHTWRDSEMLSWLENHRAKSRTGIR